MSEELSICPRQLPHTAPLPVENPAGADTLVARVGTHGAFFNALKRRLSSGEFQQLQRLRARETDDPSIALLDAWSVAADVLTFYNQRLANEAYLRTATERRSLVELAHHVGYRPGPGVAASVHLAFTLEKDPKQAAEETLIPRGTAVKSTPAGDGQPQTFETSDDLIARPEWNALRPRQSMPQQITPGNINSLDRLYLDGADPALKPGDRLLVAPDDESIPTAMTVAEVNLDTTNNRTELVLVESPLSVRKMYREVAGAVDAFLPVAKGVDTGDDFSNKWWHPTVVKSLNDLREGDKTSSLSERTVRLEQVTRLSEFDARIKAFMDGSGISDDKGSLPQTDFVALRDFSSKLAQVTGGDLTATLSKDLSELCKAIVKLDDVAKDFAKAIKPVKLSQTTTIVAAFNAIAAAFRDLPRHALLRAHEEKLDAVYDAIAELVNSPGDKIRQNAFQGASESLRTWWGFNGSWNAGTEATALRTSVGTTATDAALADKTVGAYETFKTTVAGAVSAAGNAIKDRVAEIANALAVVGKRVEIVRDIKLPVFSSPLSFIFNVNAFLAKHFNSIVTAFDLPARVRAADNVPPATRSAVQAAAGLADLAQTLTRSVNLRRRAIGERANRILGDNQLFSNSTVSAISRAKAILTAAAYQDTSDNYVTSLDVTFADLGNDNGGLIKEIKDARQGNGTASDVLLDRLWRELKGLAALNGSVAAKLIGVSVGNTVGAGLGDAANLARRAPAIGFGSPLVRNAAAALRIPGNSSADVVVQLTGLLDCDSPQDLRARWKAVRFEADTGKAPAAAKLSQWLQLFGHNAIRPELLAQNILQTLIALLKIVTLQGSKDEWKFTPQDTKGHLFLATETQVVSAPAYVLIQPGGNVESAKPFRSCSTVARSDYGLTAKTTQIDFTDPEYDWTLGTTVDKAITPLRTSLASVPVAALALGQRPIGSRIGKGAGQDPHATQLNTNVDFDPETDQIELDDVVLGIQPGMLVMVQGEHADRENVIVTELARVTRVIHILRPLDGDRVHTRLVFEKDLEHPYKRETVTIYANIVHATQGETVRQTLGSGDASRPFQKFDLARGPLTYLSAPTVTGVASTLEVRVGELKWHEQTSLLDSQANDRHYVALADEQHRITVQFGDGRGGARLSTGRENVRAVYRVGLGAAGNVKANTITQLHHRPLGVKEVDNPLPAAGGADPESIDLIRANAPLAVMALDRLVSVRDYQDFAANYAAIDSAIAASLTLGSQPTVHVTIVGADDIPISDDQINNLKLAYKKFGDPGVVVDVQPRTLKLLFFSAQVRLQPDYEWKSVEPRIRRALYQRFGFRRQRLAKRVFRSDAEAAVQAVPGVASVKFDIFAGLAEVQLREALNSGKAQNPPGAGQQAATGQTPATNSSNKLSDLFSKLGKTRDAVIEVFGPRLNLQNQAASPPSILPAELAYLSPDVPDSLFLREEVA